MKEVRRETRKSVNEGKTSVKELKEIKTEQTFASLVVVMALWNRSHIVNWINWWKGAVAFSMQIQH